MQRKGSQFICLLVIFIDSAFRTGKNYYPHVFQKKVQMLLKKKRF